jgi:adenylate kinase family enzyme
MPIILTVEDDIGFIIISGLPASGKSTVANLLVRVNYVQVIDKDDLLEELFERHAEVDKSLRSRLSREADSIMMKTAQQTNSAILVSHWKHPELSTDSGTPTEWLSELPNVAEIYCSCDPEIAVQRFLDRKRHGAHGDANANPVDLRTQFRILSDLGPIGLDRHMTVDTSSAVDLAPVVAWLGWN